VCVDKTPSNGGQKERSVGVSLVVPGPDDTVKREREGWGSVGQADRERGDRKTYTEKELHITSSLPSQ
jgi:hypothetical protein